MYISWFSFFRVIILLSLKGIDCHGRTQDTRQLFSPVYITCVHCSPRYCPPNLSQLKHIPACRSVFIFGVLFIFAAILFFVLSLLPHSAPSWILSLAVNLAGSILQDGAMKWHYSHHIPATHPQTHPPYQQPIVCDVPTPVRTCDQIECAMSPPLPPSDLF